MCTASGANAGCTHRPHVCDGAAHSLAGQTVEVVHLFLRLLLLLKEPLLAVCVVARRGVCMCETKKAHR